MDFHVSHVENQTFKNVGNWSWCKCCCPVRCAIHSGSFRSKPISGHSDRVYLVCFWTQWVKLYHLSPTLRITKKTSLKPLPNSIWDQYIYIIYIYGLKKHLWNHCRLGMCLSNQNRTLLWSTNYWLAALTRSGKQPVVDGTFGSSTVSSICNICMYIYSYSAKIHPYKTPTNFTFETFFRHQEVIQTNSFAINNRQVQSTTNRAV